MNIGIDITGGDNGSIIVLNAVKQALKNNIDTNFFLYGQKEIIFDYLKEDLTNCKDIINVIDCQEIIDMNEHPVFALRNKTNSSIFMAGQDLIQKKIDAFISAGSTGALLALAIFYVKPIEGIKRPAIAAIIPNENGQTLMIDAGANMDCEPKWLEEFAIMGSLYIKEMYKIDKPRVGLLSVGTEEAKGNRLVNDTFKLLKENKNINFVGNIEARQVPFGVCDVVVCDGFSGNTYLKTFEGTVKLLMSSIKDGAKKNILTMIGALLIKPVFKKLYKNYDATYQGGAPLLGANGLIIKCHGNVKEREIYNAILQSKSFVEHDIINKIKNSLSNV